MNALVRFTLLGLLGFEMAWSGQAQVTALRDVPDEIPAATRGSLVFAHDALAARRDALRSKVAAHNQSCTSVDEGSAAAASCEQVQATLQQEMAAYSTDVEKFNAQLDSEVENVHRRIVIPPETPSSQDHVRIGAPSMVRGEVYWLTSDGRKVPVTASIPLYSGEHIITGAGSRLEVLLLDGTTFTLGAKSDMVLDEFVYDPKTSVGKVSAKIVTGVFRFVTGKVAQKRPDNMKVELPVGHIGIRGTDFEVEYRPDAPGYIRLYSGELEISETRTGRTFTMDGGQQILIGSDGSISSPAPLPAK
jgi:hypothetical protein